MKSRLFIILMAGVALGCSDFLEETSQTEIRPSTVRDMEKILESEAYFSGEEGYIFNRGTDIFTDDVKSNVLDDGSSATVTKENQRYRFAWDRTMFDEVGGGEDISFWSNPYERINRCNLVLEYINGMDGDEVERNHIRGEAYTLRGFYYFMLVNFFGLPYNYGDPTRNPGVPVKLDSGVTDDRLARNSVSECYEQIERDLLRGTAMMKANKDAQSIKLTRLNYLAGYALLSRMYLYMEDWEKAILYADSVLLVQSDLLDLKSTTTSCVYYSTSPDEILWAGQEAYTSNSNYSLGEVYPFTVSDELVSVYVRDNDGITDIRGDYNNVITIYYSESTITPVFLKRGQLWDYVSASYGNFWVAAVLKGNVVATVAGTTTNMYNGGVRTAEMYLNRAEAAIHRYIETNNQTYATAALADLNVLRRNRFEEGYVDKELSDFTTGEELLEFCLRERRRELCGEGNHRWFDLRRSGMPQINHVYVDNNGYETIYTLQEEDPRYALPIPEEVLSRNSNLTQN